MDKGLKKIAIVAITKHGAKYSRKLRSLLQLGDLYVSAKFKGMMDASCDFFDIPLRVLVASIWPRYDAIVFFVSLGAVVRIIAPHLKNKYLDPAIIVVDDGANFVISVLSGHVGRANELTLEIARLIKASPVITTASDIGKTIPVDMLGREFGWILEKKENAAKVSAAVVNGERIGVFQDAGETNWWKNNTCLPSNIKIYDSIGAMIDEDCSAYLIITDKLCEGLSIFVLQKCVIYRPKSLVLGIGCNRGISMDDIEEFVFSTLRNNHLSFNSIRHVTTVESRKEEVGISAFLNKYNLTLLYFTKEELNRVRYVPNPSTMAMKYLGVIGVAEPSAILGSKWGGLIVPKVKSKMVTLAVARIKF